MANAGLAHVPIGLDCSVCGQPITVDYMAHGRGDPMALVDEHMKTLVAMAARRMIADPPKCSDCSPPHPRSFNAR